MMRTPRSVSGSTSTAAAITSSEKCKLRKESEDSHALPNFREPRYSVEVVKVNNILSPKDCKNTPKVSRESSIRLGDRKAYIHDPNAGNAPNTRPSPMSSKCPSGRPTVSDDAHLAAHAYPESSNASDATADNLPGAGRTVGILMGWIGNRVESLLNKWATRRGLGPAATAQEIRRLRRHDVTTFQTRLESALESSALSKAEIRSLKRLCERLMKYASSPVLSTQIKAAEEIFELTVDDPIVRRLLAESRVDRLVPNYREPDLLVVTSKALGSVMDAHTHRLWSILILDQHLPPNGGGISIPEGLAISLKDSLSRPTSSYVAARYLRRALESFELPSTGFGQRNPPKASALHGIGRHYIETAVSNPSIIEWSNLDGCVSFLGHLLVAPARNFESEGDPDAHNLLYQLTKPLIREAQHVPHTLFNYFTAPELEMILRSSEDYTDFDYEFKFEERFRLYLEGLTRLVGDGSLGKQIKFLRKFDRRTRRLLKDTIFLNEVMLIHCHLEACVSHTVFADRQFLNGPTEKTSMELAVGLLMLVNGLLIMKDDVKEKKSLVPRPSQPTILAARSLAYSRYHKLALYDAVDYITDVQGDSVPPKLFHDLYEIATARRRLRFSETSQISLARICVNGQFYLFVFSRFSFMMISSSCFLLSFSFKPQYGSETLGSPGDHEAARKVRFSGDYESQCMRYGMS
ncbi:hypothetical protein SCHPADRAFT_244812 [Schizopora paradoxa]|uniref:Uncharacterized protein n=1 Tax=Schizopora paradoxa TaxID=27342 RepID=A0A0H2RVD1_9AGAM|nr:hypothetical protein SCHPADRAFT_244812 [Schizopora paradoxa]